MPMNSAMPMTSMMWSTDGLERWLAMLNVGVLGLKPPYRFAAPGIKAA